MLWQYFFLFVFGLIIIAVLYKRPSRRIRIAANIISGILVVLIALTKLDRGFLDLLEALVIFIFPVFIFFFAFVVSLTEIFRKAYELTGLRLMKVESKSSQFVGALRKPPNILILIGLFSLAVWQKPLRNWIFAPAGTAECANSSVRDNCLGWLAIKKDDPALCLNASDKRDCLSVFLINPPSVKYCQVMDKEKDFEARCLSHFNSEERTRFCESAQSNNEMNYYVEADCYMIFDVDWKSNRNQTALLYVAKKGYAKKINKILSRKPNLNLQDNDGNTAMHLGNKSTRKLLLESQLPIDLSIKNKLGQTPNNY